MASFTSLFVAGLSLSLAQLTHGQIFTLSCFPLAVARVDPIVSPGNISGHVHSVVGGTGLAEFMSAETATGSNDTTCNRKIDHSNYWIPHIYHSRSDGGFDLVPFTGNVSDPTNLALDHALNKADQGPPRLPTI
jgi:hypothetical protein